MVVTVNSRQYCPTCGSPLRGARTVLMFIGSMLTIVFLGAIGGVLARLYPWPWFVAHCIQVCYPGQ